MAARKHIDWPSVFARYPDHTGVEIARKVGVHQGSVWYAAKKHGVQLRKGKGGPKALPWDDIFAEFPDLTAAELARKVGVHVASVRDAAKRRGIQLPNGHGQSSRSIDEAKWEAIFARNRGLTAAQITRSEGVTYNQVYYAAKRLGVTLPKDERGRGRKPINPGGVDIYDPERMLHDDEYFNAGLGVLHDAVVAWKLDKPVPDVRAVRTLHRLEKPA